MVLGINHRADFCYNNLFWTVGRTFGLPKWSSRWVYLIYVEVRYFSNLWATEVSIFHQLCIVTISPICDYTFDCVSNEGKFLIILISYNCDKHAVVKICAVAFMSTHLSLRTRNQHLFSGVHCQCYARKASYDPRSSLIFPKPSPFFFLYAFNLSCMLKKELFYSKRYPMWHMSRLGSSWK